MDKDRFDALMKLADFRVGIREARRQHEWRVSLGLWVGMGAGLVALRGIPILVLFPALIIVVLGHAIFWVRWCWKANERDIRLAYFYAEIAEGMFLPDAPTPDKRRLNKKELIYGFLTHGPPLFEVTATLLLAGGLAILAARPTDLDSLIGHAENIRAEEKKLISQPQSPSNSATDRAEKNSR